VTKTKAWAAAMTLVAAGMAAAEEAATKPPLSPVELQAARSELRDPSEAKAVDAARRIAEDLSPAATDAILDELAIGAPPRVQAELLAGLAERKDPRAYDVLAHYAQNRNPQLRKKAIVALAALPDAEKPRVEPALIAALSDPSEDVRAAGARALATREAHDDKRSPAVEDALVKLLAHHDGVAVEALGALGGPGTARRLGELFGQIPDGLLASTFSELLHRNDFGPDPIRLEVVKAIGKLTGPEATNALRDYVTETESDKQRPSRAEAKKLIELRGAQ